MTRIHFLHGTADKHQAACAWLALLASELHPIVVYLANRDEVERLDRQLWCQNPIGFVPHCRVGDALQGDTPILLTTLLDATPHEHLLLNLTPDVPPDFSRFDQLVEIVSVDEADRHSGRMRFRYYRERGYELNSVDISNGIVK